MSVLPTFEAASCFSLCSKESLVFHLKSPHLYVIGHACDILAMLANDHPNSKVLIHAHMGVCTGGGLGGLHQKKSVDSPSNRRFATPNHS